MTLRRFEPADRPWLRRQNTLVDQVNRLSRPGTPGEAQMGAAGVTFIPPPPTHVALFELTGPLVYPDGSDPDAPDVPSAPAVPVWYLAADDVYGGIELAPAATLYHPAALRDDEGRPLGTASLCAGMRCHAWHNPQSDRWEIVEPPLGLMRFELTEALACGGSAEAIPRLFLGGSYIDDPLGRTVTVHDAAQRFSKMATAEGDAGALGWAWWMPDRMAWEILDMQVPGDFFGALKDDLGQGGASAVVEVIAGEGLIGGYNIFGVNFGNEITVYNPPGGGNFADHWHAAGAGDRVFCRWDVRQARYWILAVEPNHHEYQTLQVVTGVDFGSQTVTMKTIELPPWVEVG